MEIVRLEINTEDKSKSINISRISEVSHSKENSDQHANKNYSKVKKEENIKSMSNSESQNPSKLMYLIIKFRSSWKQQKDYELNKIHSKKSIKLTESIDMENNSDFRDDSLHQNDLDNVSKEINYFEVNQRRILKALLDITRNLKNLNPFLKSRKKQMLL